MISLFIQIFGTYASQAHFRAALLNTFGENLKMSKEVISKKKADGSATFIHRVHARCAYSGNSRFTKEARQRERQDSKLVDSFVLL